MENRAKIINDFLFVKKKKEAAVSENGKFDLPDGLNSRERYVIGTVIDSSVFLIDEQTNEPIFKKGDVVRFDKNNGFETNHQGSMVTVIRIRDVVNILE